jgi:membrane-bound ClpP family serine protease
MLINIMTSTTGPALGNILISAGLWVITMMIILYKQTGIQLIGTFIILTGLAALLLQSKISASLSLIIAGVLIHCCGRLLLNIRKRR